MSAAYSDLYNEALSLYDSNNMEEAHAIIKQVLAEIQDDAEVWCLEAQIQLVREEWEAADFAVEQALKLASDTFPPHFIQAHLYNASGRYEDACEAANNSIAVASTEEEVRDGWQQLAEAYFGVGETHLKEDIEMSYDEDDDGAGHILTPEIADMFRQGMEAVEKVIEIDSQLPEAWELYANYLVIFNETEGALQAWRTAVELSPDNPEYLHGLGQALEDIEDFEEAQDIYTQLYYMEQEVFDSGSEPLIFPPEEFSLIANDIWVELQHDLIGDDEIPLVFEFTVAVYPGQELIDEASEDSIFDPRVGIHVELLADPFSSMSDNPAPPVVRLHLFQRNIERDLDSNNKDELVDVVETLLETCIAQIYEYMEAPEE